MAMLVITRGYLQQMLVVLFEKTCFMRIADVTHFYQFAIILPSDLQSAPLNPKRVDGC